LKTWIWAERRSAVQQYRTKELLRLQKVGSRPYRQAKKNYQHTQAYIHLTHDERWAAVKAVAQAVSTWGNARLFAECVDKIHFDPSRAKLTTGEQAFEQVVSRFQNYLSHVAGSPAAIDHGLLIHDNNEAVAKKHTELMRQFPKSGTLWATIDHITETPLFVDSRLTRMVQIADLCAVALRRIANPVKRSCLILFSSAPIAMVVGQLESGILPGYLVDAQSARLIESSKLRASVAAPSFLGRHPSTFL
jgi:uncharacterized protein DUF3800